MIIHNNNIVDVLVGDCRESLVTLKGANIQMCVTSPPYFGLRDYGNDNQIGLEQTPEEYIANMVEVFRLVRDALADDGTLWLNVGDSYSGSGKGPAGNLGKTHNERHLEHKHGAIVPQGMKPKDLIGIPWMLAFALRADGWYLRQDIIWYKPNPMPESVRDRCTKAHEYVFLLSKSQKYYYDNEAIKEKAVSSDKRPSALKRSRAFGYGEVSRSTIAPDVRNKRSVWSINTKPFKGAHFAVFPPELVEPCILAGSKPNDLILDPFGGSGTTGGVALKYGRNAILCELNNDYVDIMESRIRSIAK